MSSQIQSIGWLYSTGGMITLTPVFAGSGHPVKVEITRAEFEAIRHSPDLMKAKALEKLGRK